MNTILKILAIKAFLLICINSGTFNIIPFHSNSFRISEIPVLDLRFYMMGREDADIETIKSIKENVKYLNDEFEGVIKFEIKQLFVHNGQALLPDLHKEYFGMEELLVDSLVKEIENKGSVNIYIFDSYVDKELNAELMGFTPILKAKHKEYINTSPSFDRIFLAYNALRKQTTLVHEMGHFLGLEHPWEMSKINKGLMGLYSKKDIENNHMAYGFSVESFTREQLDRMQSFALQFRSYLILRKEYKIDNKMLSSID